LDAKKHWRRRRSKFGLTAEVHSSPVKQQCGPDPSVNMPVYAGRFDTRAGHGRRYVELKIAVLVERLTLHLQQID
jgi:hypothetical protein